VENPNLIEFFGTECLHCIRMKPTVEKFEKKHKIILTKIEVWHSEENNKTMEDIPEFKQCGGVPFFYNKETRKFICGECSLEELENWAK